jgi:hypothetical protein
VNPLAERRLQDLAKIKRLGERARGRISVTDTLGTPPSEITVALNYKTAGSARYPEDVRDTTRIKIVLGARYPFLEPAVDILDPVFNPNVYPSGRVCLGKKWLATEGLDLIVLRVAKILTFDREILNDWSPAHMEAAHWYKAMLRDHPGAFPSDTLGLVEEAPPKKMVWGEKT